MRVGLSWDLDGADPVGVWRAVIGEISVADGLGFESAWLDEAREVAAGCPSPAIVLTFAARRTSSIQLRSLRRRIRHGHPVRVAEEIALLDLFSRGRAGVCFATDDDAVWERIDFVCTAWTSDEFRYRGVDLRFPAHTGDDAPRGASFPEPSSDAYVPQWERGPARPDHLSVTPKPYQSRPPVWIEAGDRAALRRAAEMGVAPFFGAALEDDDVAAGASAYLRELEVAGRPRWAEIVVERRFPPGDDGLVERLRALAKRASCSHLVWRRTPEQLGRADELYAFSQTVQPLLQT